MNVRIATVARAGRASGRMIRVKINSSPAPAMRAASISSSGMLISAARKSIIGMPTHCHTEISERAGSAVPSRPSHGLSYSARPNRSRKSVEMPHSGLRIMRQMKPTSTTDSTVGVKISVR